MGLRTQGKNLQLKVSLTDTQLLSVLRERAEQLLGHRSSSHKVHRKFIHPQTSDVVAQFNTQHDTLTLTGMLNQHFPIQFTLKPQTKTYENFLRFFLKELKELTPFEHSPAPATPSGEDEGMSARSKQADLGQMSTLEKTEVVRELARHIEEKLQLLNREALATVDDLQDIVDVYSEDLEPAFSLSKSERTNSKSRVRITGREERRKCASFVLHRLHAREEKKFRLVEATPIPTARHISGFLSLEIQEVLPESSSVTLDSSELFEELHFLSRPTLESQGDSVTVRAEIFADRRLQPFVEFGIHWGSYGKHACPWVDEEVSQSDLTWSEDGRLTLRKEISHLASGSYGLTLYVQLISGERRRWLGSYQSEDLTFQILQEEANAQSVDRRSQKISKHVFHADILRALSSFDAFVRYTNIVLRTNLVRDFGKQLFECTKDEASLRRLISDYYQQTIIQLGEAAKGPVRRRLRNVLTVLQNLGVGETVFVAPEGPHAIAGGLAQVIVGLTSALSKTFIPTTIISPLYEEAQGSKHKSAEEIIRSGVELNGKSVMLREVGDLKIPFGPALRAGTEEIITAPRIVVARVYLAESEGVRAYFLRHHRLADKLYSPASSEDQIRKSIFLSRGALELIRDSRFGIRAEIIVTNDWQPALVPVLLRTDVNYQNDPMLRDIETVHILHNCGRDYQGRFFTNQYGVDLYPLLGISPQHYFGLADPLDSSHLNFTAGAVFHAGKGLVAVSRPYAQQLLTREGGEGLDGLFCAQRSSLYGISNGINLQALRDLLWSIGERTRQELSLKPLAVRRPSASGLVRILRDYKQAAKKMIQRRYELEQKPEALLFAFVGRLAEQKGIQLLTDSVPGSNVSLLESMLQQYPDVQFIIAGPPSNGDATTTQLMHVVGDLELRYRGRIRGIYAFVPHQEALAITHASDFFLMPSRYEPGGITQLEALACGTLVIARNVGGLAATLIDCSMGKGRGNSFLFQDFQSSELRSAIIRAIESSKNKNQKLKMLRQAAGAENDWSHRVPKFISVLQKVSGVLDSESSYSHLSGRKHLLSSLRP